MTESRLSEIPESARSIATLNTRLKSGSEKNQLQLIQELAADSQWDVLMEFFRERSRETSNLVLGKAYQVLLAANDPQVTEFLQTYWPIGVVPLHSECNLDYHPLQQLLAKQEFQAADQLTLQKLCELAGAEAVQRKWLYFTEIDQLPILDLQTINSLWLTYSEGKFGFSVQREIWLSVSQTWEKLWPKIGWKNGNNWTRYPQEFTWNLTAPRGHLPLTNQLRGVRVINSLLNHPAWTNKIPLG